MVEGLRLFCNKVSRVRLIVRYWSSTGSEISLRPVCRLSSFEWEEPAPISWTGLGGKKGARTGLALTVGGEVGEGGGDKSSSVHLQWSSSSSSTHDGPAENFKFSLPTVIWFLDTREPEESRDLWSWCRIREQSEHVWWGRGVLGVVSFSGTGIFSDREGSNRPERWRMEEQGFEGFGDWTISLDDVGLVPFSICR